MSIKYKRPSFLFSGFVIAAFPAWLALQIFTNPDLGNGFGWFLIVCSLLSLGWGHMLAGERSEYEQQQELDARAWAKDKKAARKAAR